MFTGWILIIFAHVGPMGEGNSNALTTAHFRTESACISAGKAAAEMARGTVKEIDFRCVVQSD
jgi:hypothetical protein